VYEYQRWDEDIGRLDHGVSGMGVRTQREIALPAHMSREGRAVRLGCLEDTWRTFHVVSG
jgi:hypothetical protein